MPSLGGPELMIILVIVIVLFGVGKLSGVGGALGQSIRDFKKAVGDEDQPAKEAAKPAEAKAEESASS
jgi:sec-independent protein translocase protein TatA